MKFLKNKNNYISYTYIERCRKLIFIFFILGINNNILNMKAHANFVPPEQINLKNAYENANGHCNGSKYF